jgi:hypothetical protein
MLEARDDGLRAAEAMPGEFYFVRVYETKGAALGTATRLSPNLFDGPSDEFRQIDRDTGTMPRSIADDRRAARRPRSCRV